MGYARRETEQGNLERNALIIMSKEEIQASDQLASALRRQGMFVCQVYEELNGRTYMRHKPYLDILIVGKGYEHMAENIKNDSSREKTLTLAISDNGAKADMKFTTETMLIDSVKKGIIPPKRPNNGYIGIDTAAERDEGIEKMLSV